MNESGHENLSHPGRLIEIVRLAKTYCDICEEASQYSKIDFTNRVLSVLPLIYWNFFDLENEEIPLEEYGYLSSYMEEDSYEDLKIRIARVMGGDDVFLDTFEEDMQYSDTPISSSISECLAEIYQPLYNFVCIVKDSAGTQLQEAFIECKQEFENYWSQTLCNVLKALNNIKYNNRNNDEEF